MNSEWRRARHDRRLRERRLPRGLRDDVRRLRRDDLAEEVMDSIFEKVEESAHSSDFFTVKTTMGERKTVLPAAERAILRTLNANLSFRGSVRRRVNDSLRLHHLLKVDPAARITLPQLGASPFRDGDLLRLRSSIGLGTATVLDGEPEDWDHFVISELLKHHVGEEEDADADLERPVLRVYAIGAGAGGIARVAASVQSWIRIEVKEQDAVMTSTTDLPSVVGSRGEMTTSRPFDGITVVLPTPALSGASAHRRIYGEAGDGDDEAELSRLGAGRWLELATVWVLTAGVVLAEHGMMYVLVPAAIRAREGYADAPELIDGLVERLEAGGLAIVEKLKVVEIAPVAQPFVGRHRPQRWSLALRRSAVEAAGAP